MKKVYVMFSLIFLLQSCEEEKKSYEQDLENFPSMDFEASLKDFEKSEKATLIYFTGFGCVNCMKFNEVIKAEIGLENIKTKYDFISLYVDGRKKLPESEWFKSPWYGNVKTNGGVNSVILFEKLQSGDIPALAIMNKEGEIIKQKSGFKYNIKEFLEIED